MSNAAVEFASPLNDLISIAFVEFASPPIVGSQYHTPTTPIIASEAKQSQVASTALGFPKQLAKQTQEYDHLPL